MAAAGVLLIVCGAWIAAFSGPCYRQWLGFYRLVNGANVQWYDGTRLEALALRLGGRARLVQVGLLAIVIGCVLLAIVVTP